jgi:hypothetical protein
MSSSLYVLVWVRPFTPPLCDARASTWSPYGHAWCLPPINNGGRAMADLFFLALGGGLFLTFAAFVAALRRV